LRWGILANLAVISIISGLALFLVFSASIKRAAIDAKIQDSNAMADLVENQVLKAESSEKLWDKVRSVCAGRTGLRLALYGADGKVLGGCGANPALEAPTLSDAVHRVRIIATDWPWVLFQDMSVVVDRTGSFPHGVQSVRLFLDIPSSVFAPAWKFFAAYLTLTQFALFLLGYILFHRTVIGPIREVAQLAEKSSGVAEIGEFPDTFSLQGDIQKISAGLKKMIVKIVDDREKMEKLVEQLSAINRDLQAAHQGLIRSEKLASVGRLASGVAHEIGNPLQILLGYIELLGRGADPEQRREILPRMEQELRRIHQILRRLLDFARPIQSNVVECDVNELLKDCAALVKGRKGFHHVEFLYELDPQASSMLTEPEKIRQAVVNLVINAADATGQGGKIMLRTRARDNNVEIEIEDNGCGISSENLEKVFDPFFTTKEPGRGTGLGLAVCLGLVESLGGSMNLASEVGRGTTASLKLAAQRDEPTVKK
jgi:signal transduction histidine kinase